MDANFLQEITKAVQAAIHSSQSEVMTADDASAFLHITKPYLYKLTSTGVLPFSKPNGKMIYFSRTDLVKWALSNRRTGSEELESKAATYLALKRK